MKILFGLVVCSILVAGIADHLPLPKSGQKRVERKLEKLYPGQNLSLKQIDLEGYSDDPVYAIMNNGKKQSWLYLAKGQGKFEHFDYMVIYNSDLSIKEVQVLVYREDYGGEIGSSRWLRQFIGKKDPAEMELQDDIAAISGATISVRSITSGIQKITSEMQRFRKLGLL